jgi:hypothetical protein
VPVPPFQVERPPLAFQKTPLVVASVDDNRNTDRAGFWLNHAGYPAFCRDMESNKELR